MLCLQVIQLNGQAFSQTGFRKQFERHYWCFKNQSVWKGGVHRACPVEEHVEDFEMPEAYTCLNFLDQHFPNGPEQGAFVGRVLVNENTGIGYVFLYKRCWAPASAISAETRGVARAFQDLCEKARGGVWDASCDWDVLWCLHTQEGASDLADPSLLPEG